MLGITMLEQLTVGETIALGAGKELAVALIGIAVLIVLSTAMRRLEARFAAEVVEVINRNPMAAAVREGARWLGMCIVIGLLLG